MNSFFAYRVAFFATCFAVCVVMLGAYTRLVHAGLGCPDWPGCYGFLVVPHSTEEIAQAKQAFPEVLFEEEKGWPEMIHRYFVGGLLLLVVALNVLAFKNRNEKNYPLKLSFGILVLIILQALFGMWTVTLKLWPQVVTLHLLGGFATLCLLFLLTLRLQQCVWKIPASVWKSWQPYKIPALIGLSIVILQISLGGWTSSNYAALACLDLPTCHGQWLPPMDLSSGFNIFQEIGPNYLGGMLDNDARTAIHYAHRVGALVTTLYTLCFIIGLWKKTDATPLKRTLGLLLAALVIQVCLGLSNVLFSLPLPIAVLHNIGGACLLLVWINVNYRLATTVGK